MNIQPTGELVENVAETQNFRSQVGHISRHSGALFAGTIFSAAFGYMFKVYLARILGAEALGIYALGITLVGLIGVFNSLGLPESAVRFAAVYRATNRPQALRSLLWRGASTLLAANVLFAIAFLTMGAVIARRFYHSSELAHYIPWFAGLMLLGVFSTFYGRILAGYKAVGRRTVITNFIGTPATMLIAILLLSMGKGLRGYLLAQVVAAAAVMVLLLTMVMELTPKESRALFPWPAPLEREVWTFSATAIGVLLLEFLLVQIDKIALGFYLNARSVGIYSVAAAMVAYETLVLNSVNQVFSPIIADLHARGDLAMLGRLYKALTKWVFGLTLPLAATVIVFSRALMRIFGHDFEAGWPILVIGTLGQLVNCGVGSVGLLLMMSGNQQRLLKVQAVMAGFMMLTCAAFIPLWGIIGAAVASAATNIGTNTLNFLSVHRVLSLSPFSRSFARLFAPGISSVLVALAVRRGIGVGVHDWIGIAASLLATYAVFAVVLAAMGLDADDRLIVRAIWGRMRQSVPSF